MTQQKIQEAIAKVNEMKKGGMSAIEAIGKTGLTSYQYYYYTRKLKPAVSKPAAVRTAPAKKTSRKPARRSAPKFAPKVQSIPMLEAPANLTFRIDGSPRAVAELMRQLGGGTNV